MPKFEEFKCPVCKQQFDVDDDIVTCPVCGTPHHRHCYDLTGHCVNKGLHSAGYNYYDDKENSPAPQTSTKPQTDGAYYIPPIAAEHEEKQPRTFGLPADIGLSDEEYAHDSETINGESISDYAATIRINIPRFITKFKQMEKTKRKAGWNWCAFFFGSFYLLFRKMYKQGIMFLCMNMAAVMGEMTLILKMAPKYVQAMQDLYANASDKITVEQLNEIMKVSDFATAVKIVYVTLAVLLMIRIIIAVFADYFYKNTVSDIIKKVGRQIKDGASFMQSPIMMNTDEDLSQEQMRRMYLARLGGVSWFAPSAAYLIIMLAFRLI